ncbi:MAG: Hsp20/alpha crystallin family protein [Acidobacteria bacterium]|nr:Hsp20/alpha crystallin family protein [Acidobacteriota bacterium]MCW5967755.1 Hsp20/alpha crystallin family protein [Blastocatellales bacterium]
MSWMIRRDPLNELRGMQEEVNRVFQTAFPRIFGTEEGLLRGSWSPTVDIFENQDTFVLEADLPGLQPGDFDLSIENFTLTLRGERKFEKKTEGDNYHRVERSYGAFTRTFTLPSTIDVEGVQAEFRDGVLRVTLPKREEVKPRQVQIAVKTEADAGAKVKKAEAK